MYFVFKPSTIFQTYGEGGEKNLIGQAGFFGFLFFPLSVSARRRASFSGLWRGKQETDKTQSPSARKTNLFII
jgi:hypothetical protein